ncbi:MAG TPA: transcriptional repressor [Polyangium sp.]|nr:transcriptional repressor [Polyangium sp.]
MRKATQPPVLDAVGIHRALEQLHGVVRAKGLKNSEVRDAVARVALAYDGHFTVEDLVKTLRETGTVEAHPATVYRIVPLLVEAGLLQETLVSAGEGHRYERAFEREHHDHLICTSCGKVVEFEFEAIEVLQRNIAERFGFYLTGHVHELFGLCSKCAPKGGTR